MSDYEYISLTSPRPAPRPCATEVQCESQYPQLGRMIECMAGEDREAFTLLLCNIRALREWVAP